MCKKKHRIQLCSCANINNLNVVDMFAGEINKLNAARNELFTLVLWNLKRFIKEEWQGMDGMLVEPLTEVTEELTGLVLCGYLNQTNCFDFEYNPNEGDVITFEPKYYNSAGIKIFHEDGYQSISLIYRNNRWCVEQYDLYYTKTEFLNQGFLRPKSN